MRKSAWAIVLDSEGNVLLLKRAKSCNNAGLYNFPGGTVDKGEKPIDSAKRELKEEAGIKAKLKPILNILDKKADKKSFFGVVKVDVRPNVKINDESETYEWVPLHKVSSYPLHPPTYLFFKALNKNNVNL